jgi:hypothetical protein
MNIRPFECALVLSALLAVVVPAQEPQDPPRYGFDYNPILYPQKKPEDAIKSIVKAIDAKRVDYLLAQLADPKFVDAQVADYRASFPKGKEDARTFLAFDRLVSDTVEYFLSDPILVKELRKFARDATWDIEDQLATGTLKDVPARKVFLKRIGERWFLENRQQ